MRMHEPLVFFNELGRDVPAAVVASGRLVVAAVTIERSAVEELLQPGPIFGLEIAGLAGQRQLMAATFAASGIESS